MFEYRLPVDDCINNVVIDYIIMTDLSTDYIIISIIFYENIYSVMLILKYS